MSIPSLVASKCIERPVKVYGLFDPRDTSCFYVGVTTKPYLCSRLSSHVNDARHLQMAGDRYDHIRSIEACGFKTEITELETVDGADWPEAEQFWIQNMKSFGFKLTNKSIGGPGALGIKQSSLTKKRRQDAAAGRNMDHLRGSEIRDKVSLKTRTPIMYEGIIYAGLAVAARALGISSGHMHYKVSKGYATRVAA